MKKIKATFKGLDGSLGYRNNQDYILDIKLLKDSSIEITNFDLKHCIYSNFITFLQNWDNVRSI